ncbi:hypothetical protein PX860_10675 [Agrobacterium leguminum]|uniref:hypothetical protein n=1 Tax=Agrobacterium leguminum TaxID=2792015 RepID=UPI00272B8715|nr:hypothetical protein [Agrobacterium leguminum]WLD96031.1 hypothetical protein PX860_10675 [Agrobacterium leguminum]
MATELGKIFLIKYFSRENIFAVLSLFLATIFAWGFFSEAGFPPTRVAQNWQLLVVFMIFLILPFAKKLDFFQFFSFEAKIDAVRSEVGDAKQKVAEIREDVRHVIAQQNALSASIQANNHQAVTVNNYDRPRKEEVFAATAEVADVEPVTTAQDPSLEGQTSDDKLLEAIFGTRDPDISDGVGRYERIADLFHNIDELNAIRKISLSERVAILRVRVEREIRRLARNRGIKERQMPAFELVRNVSRMYSELLGQRESFDIFFRIANAAVHGEDVPSEDLNTAIFLGERLLGLLTKIESDAPSTH